MKKKILAALLAVCMVATLLPATVFAADNTFDDVADDHWAKESIETWADYGVLSGHGDGTFAPDTIMTRAQFAAMIVKLMGYTEEADISYTDTEDHWAKADLAKVAAAGVMNGYPDGSAKPDNEITFGQAALMLCRALGLTGAAGAGDTTDSAIEALTGLELLDEEDEHVNSSADATRAVVAALVDNMIDVYVTPANVDEVTEDGVITGEVKGVIVVMAGADGVAVEIKDVTTDAPIVLQGGNVTLTGTTAASVKVGGGQATVIADEDSTIGDVTVTGTNVNLSLEGKVDSVVVTKDATVSHITGAGVSTENVTNESANEITVNDETVAAAPAEEDPDDGDTEDPDDEVVGGFVPNPVTPPANITSGTANPAATDERTDSSIPAAATGTDGGTPKADCEHTNWGTAVVTTAPTCTEKGTAVYTCQADGCGATKTVEVAARDHDYTASTRVTFDAEKHYVLCKYCDVKQGEGVAHTLSEDASAVYYNSASHSVSCTGCGYTEYKSHTAGETYGYNDTFHWLNCAATSCADKVKFRMAQHSYDWASATEKKDADGNDILEAACVCGKKATKPKPADAGDGEVEEHTHSWSTGTSANDYGKNDTHHWKVCTAAGCTLNGAAPAAADQSKAGYTTHTFVYATENPTTTGTCACGKTETCTHGSTEVGQTCETCHTEVKAAGG